MKTLRDATVLLGLLLLLTSVKIGPVDASANVVPLTEAGVFSTGQALPASNEFSAEVGEAREMEIQLDHEVECTSSVIVFEGQHDGGPLVLRVQAMIPRLVLPAPEPAPQAEELALWACDKG
jgi:hypothetical protein